MRTIPASELIINDDGSIFHLHLRPEQLADTVILVGDPGRVELVATFLAVLELCKARVLHLAGSETDCIVRQECDDVPENLTF